MQLTRTVCGFIARSANERAIIVRGYPKDADAVPAAQSYNRFRNSICDNSGNLWEIESED